MKIGLFFGSFNPIHIGHIIIANHILEFSNLNKIWFIVSPSNPQKLNSTLLNSYKRLYLVYLATIEYKNFQVSDVEFIFIQPSYTVDTLIYLKKKYLNYEFILIIGEDNFYSFNYWKDYKYIIKNYTLFIYPRVTKKLYENKLKGNIIKFEGPIIDISSTLIREMIKKNKNVRPLLPKVVWEYIQYNNLYKY